MGQQWRFLSTIGFVATVACVGSHVNAAVYAHAQNEQRPITSHGSSAAARGNPLTSAFADFARETLDEWKVPGVSVAVIDGDEVYAEGYGYATLPDVPATPETLWYGASTSKAQVAAVLSALIHSGNYSALSQGWTTPISSIIRDDFVLQDEWATNHITLDDAVSHRTGMARHDRSSVSVIDGRQATPRDVVRNLRNLPLTEQPRVRPLYCNMMYVTLSHVIETITGQWLGDVLKEKLWGPLGMHSTKFDLQDALDAPEHMASGYAWDSKKQEFQEIAFLNVTEISGAGSVISNVLDYAKWIKSLIHQSGPLSEDVHEDIRSPRVLWDAAKGHGYDLMLYGLGWSRSLHKGHVVYTHSGGMHAYGAEVYWFPEVKYGVVVFGNTATCHVVEEIIAWKLIEDKLGIPEKDRLDYVLKWKKARDNLTWLYENAVDVLYPKRPDPVLPSTLATSELVGSYYDPGYGKFTLREEPHPDKPGEKILVADRPETTWKYSMHFHHVTGDHWIVYLPASIYAGVNFEEYVAGEFKLDVSGKVSGVEIIWKNLADPMLEGVVLFKRVE
ncbi:penicillin-binding [Trichoderma arundinaceum]|uniref:Penicillin-binding n=1 Tax=Trichoderma arundinaceum TaxID=490622 RepID=A0A395NCD3_TRIAR|nr:penicillin-binding [Trichoderma arundinaceum]